MMEGPEKLDKYFERKALCYNGSVITSASKTMKKRLNMTYMTWEMQKLFVLRMQNVTNHEKTSYVLFRSSQI